MNRRLKGEWGDRPSGRREPHSKNSEVKYTRDCRFNRFNLTEPGCVLGNKCGKGGWGNRSESLPALLQLGLYSMVGGEPVQIFIQRKICQNDKSERVTRGRVVS